MRLYARQHSDGRRVGSDDQRYRVTRAFLPFGTWTKFRRHVSQKRRLSFEYEHTKYDTVLFFEFFLPLTNETVLRMSLDSLFYRDTIQKQLLAIGIPTLRMHFGGTEGANDADYLQELIEWIGDNFGGYSISHVSGRFKTRPDKGEPGIVTMQEAAALQERAGRYLIDETTAITRFICPCKNREDAETDADIADQIEGVMAQWKASGKKHSKELVGDSRWVPRW